MTQYHSDEEIVIRNGEKVYAYEVITILKRDLLMGLPHFSWICREHLLFIKALRSIRRALRGLYYNSKYVNRCNQGERVLHDWLIRFKANIADLQQFTRTFLILGLY